MSFFVRRFVSQAAVTVPQAGLSALVVSCSALEWLYEFCVASNILSMLW